MEENEGRNLTDGGSEIVQETSPLVSCFWCEGLHPAHHPLSVCPACAARFSTMRSLEMSGSYPLSDSVTDRALTLTSPGNYALGYMDGDRADTLKKPRGLSVRRQAGCASEATMGPKEREVSAMSRIFVCDRDGCRPGLRQNSGVPRINVERHGRTPETASKAAAKEFLASNLRYLQVETTVDEDRIGA